MTIDALNDDPKSNYHNTVAAANPLLRAFYSLDPVIRDLELPVDVMPPEGFHRIGEFWGLMGSGAIWHPSAYVIVTLPIERARRGPPGRRCGSIGATYDRRKPTPSPETLFILAGKVSTPLGRPVPHARATLTRQALDPRTGTTREYTEVTLTDNEGKFVFEMLPAGPVDLSCANAVKQGANVPPLDPKEYDLTTP